MMNIVRKPLTNTPLPQDVLDAYDATEDPEPLPNGRYRAVAVAGTPGVTSTEKDYYRVDWRVLDGDHEGRRVSRLYYLTKDALPYTKKALKKLRLPTGDQLNRPFPANRFVCELTVTSREFNGETLNEVKSFTVVEEVDPVADDFAPPPAEGGDARG